MRKQLDLAFLAAVFMSPRDDHPARKGKARHRSAIGKQVSGDSKWHRRVEAAGMKGKC